MHFVARFCLSFLLPIFWRTTENKGSFRKEETEVLAFSENLFALSHSENVVRVSKT